MAVFEVMLHFVLIVLNISRFKRFYMQIYKQMGVWEEFCISIPSQVATPFLRLSCVCTDIFEDFAFRKDFSFNFYSIASSNTACISIITVMLNLYWYFWKFRDSKGCAVNLHLYGNTAGVKRMRVIDPNARLCFFLTTKSLRWNSRRTRPACLKVFFSIMFQVLNKLDALCR